MDSNGLSVVQAPEIHPEPCLSSSFLLCSSRLHQSVSRGKTEEDSVRESKEKTIALSGETMRHLKVSEALPAHLQEKNKKKTQPSRGHSSALTALNTLLHSALCVRWKKTVVDSVSYIQTAIMKTLEPSAEGDITDIWQKHRKVRLCFFPAALIPPPLQHQVNSGHHGDTNSVMKSSDIKWNHFRVTSRRLGMNSLD